MPEMPPIDMQFDGRLFWTLAEFYEHATQALEPGFEWGRNYAAFNDILRMGPTEGFVLRWKHSALSKERLGEKSFGILCEIIRERGKGGAERSDGVDLVLE